MSPDSQLQFLVVLCGLHLHVKNEETEAKRSYHLPKLKQLTKNTQAGNAAPWWSTCSAGANSWV